MAIHSVTLDGVKQMVNLTAERRHMLQFFGDPSQKYYRLC